MICCLSRDGIRERLREPPLDPSGIAALWIDGAKSVHQD